MTLPLVMQFARSPQRGKVKTRLQPLLGEDKTLQLHQWMLEKVVSNCCRPELWQYQLWVDGDMNAPVLPMLQSMYSLSLVQQQGHNLGDKMGFAVERGQMLSKITVLIGSDCPLLTVDYLQQSIDRLDQGADVVLGPAEDGGYVLLASKGYYPELFECIDWGSDKVLQQTRQRLTSTGCNWHELPKLWDIDRPEDLLRYARQAALPFTLD